MARKESRKTTGPGKRGQAGKGTDASREPFHGEESGGGTATDTLPITHEQIAERARRIWEQHGRPQGEDEQNWREAERQLKNELGID